MSANPVARPASRRGILAAALAGTAASAATVAGHVAQAASVAPDPTVKLAEAAERARAVLNEAMEVYEAAAHRWDREQGGEPAYPEALIYRDEEDRALSLYGSHLLNRSGDVWVFSADYVKHLRSSPRRRYVEEPHPSLPPPNVYARPVPWPEAQARADEIVAAWDARQAEVERRRHAAGLPEATQVWKAAGEAYDAALRALFTARATTREGIEAKADFVSGMFADDADFTFDLEHEETMPDHALALSIVRDVLALRGRA